MFVPKKNGKLRLVIDYRQLNEITVKDRTPLPLIGELKDSPAKAPERVESGYPYSKSAMLSKPSLKSTSSGFSSGDLDSSLLVVLVLSIPGEKLSGEG